MRRMILPLIFGLGGAAILISLGVWQVQRLAWKNAVLDEIETRISAPPVPLPAVPDANGDRYLPVAITGRTTGDELHLLVSLKGTGPGYRIVSAFETSDRRRIMLDEGYIRTTEKDTARPVSDLTITGNLHWPVEVDGFTPDPQLDDNIWFARDVPAMAAALGAEQTLVIARSVSPPDARPTPLPVDSAGIPNDHLEYAITWFSLALVWLGMTGFLLSRIHRRTV